MSKDEMKMDDLNGDFEIRTGKFGCYFYDKLMQREVTLFEAQQLMNLARAPVSVSPPVPDDVAEAKLQQIIGEAIGQASMCWKPYPTGVFDSVRASEICDGAIGLIRAASTPSKGDNND